MSPDGTVLVAALLANQTVDLDAILAYAAYDPLDVLRASLEQQARQLHALEQERRALDRTLAQVRHAVQTTAAQVVQAWRAQQEAAL